MGKIHKLKINRFDEGISDDPREPISERNAASLIKHFDCFSNPFKLTPYRSTESDHATNVSSTDAKQYDIRDFQLGSDGALFGLGKNGSGYPKVLKKTDPTTGNWLASDGTNAATAIGEGTTARIPGCFIEWQGYFIFFEGTNKITKVLISTGVASSVGTVGSTIKSVAQGVVGADNNLYLFYNNQVVRISPALAVTDTALSAIPSDMRITSATRWGNYLMLGLSYGTSAITKPIGRSLVIQWDMVTTATVNDVIDWGEGLLRVLGNVEGYIVGVSDKYLSSSLGLAKGSMVIRMWNGGQASVVKEIVANQTVTADTTAFPGTVTRFPSNVVIKNNKMYWVASVPFGASTSTESTFHLGIWAFGRKTINSNFTLSLDYVEEGVDTSNSYINSFGSAGDYWFINHSADGSINKTDDTANYTFTSIYETQIWNPAGSRIKKQLRGVTVDMVTLPTAGQVVLKYKIDAETSFTTIFTEATDALISRSAVSIASGGNLPEFRELILRVESTGGAEITNIEAQAEEVAKDIYD